MTDENDRRGFLKSLAVVGGASAMAPLGSLAGAAGELEQPVPAGEVPPAAYLFFTAVESAFVEAAADRFIPADELTPGGADCGVATFDGVPDEGDRADLMAYLAEVLTVDP
jgi:gluconate 2-dehydrogenase gamma chain